MTMVDSTAGWSSVSPTNNLPRKRVAYDMRIIPSFIHGILDYLVGIILIAAPWLLDFNRGGIETWLPVALGMSAIVYSLMTDYELGAIRVIPLSVHLTLDLMSGILLAASPWLFGFADQVYMPHLIFGLLEIGAAAMTRTTPRIASSHAHV
jgi:hypothetical protein